MVLPNFKENLEKYAKLLVANGINVQPGHTLALEHRCGTKRIGPLDCEGSLCLGGARSDCPMGR